MHLLHMPASNLLTLSCVRLVLYCARIVHTLSLCTYPSSFSLFLQIFGGGSISAAAELPILTRTWPVNLYPYLAVLPQTGSILVIAGAETDIYATTSSALAGIDSRYPAIPNLPVPVSYPQTASFAMLTLEPANQYTPEVGLFTNLPC